MEEESRSRGNEAAYPRSGSGKDPSNNTGTRNAIKNASKALYTMANAIALRIATNARGLHDMQERREETAKGHKTTCRCYLYEYHSDLH